MNSYSQLSIIRHMPFHASCRITKDVGLSRVFPTVFVEVHFETCRIREREREQAVVNKKCDTSRITYVNNKGKRGIHAMSQLLLIRAYWYVAV